VILAAEHGLTLRTWVLYFVLLATFREPSFIHEAAEKYLKIAVLHVGLPPEQLGKGKYRHNLNHLIDALAGRQNKYVFLRKPANELHALLDSMNARRPSSPEWQS
jgi:hypothetical protein